MPEPMDILICEVSTIAQATTGQAERLFEIMVRAIEVGCAPDYPPEIIRIWNKGRSAEGMAGVIAKEELYALHDDGVIRGFVHIADSEIVGLFVHPDDQRRGSDDQGLAHGDCLHREHG